MIVLPLRAVLRRRLRARRVPRACRRARARAEDGAVHHRSVAPFDDGHPVRRRDHDPARSGSWARRRCSGCPCSARSSARSAGSRSSATAPTVGPLRDSLRILAGRRAARRVSGGHPPARPRDRAAAARRGVPRGEGRRADRAGRYRGRRGDRSGPVAVGFPASVASSSWSVSRSRRRRAQARSSSAPRSTSSPTPCANASRSSSTRRTSCARRPLSSRRLAPAQRAVEPSWRAPATRRCVRSAANGPPAACACDGIAAERERGGRVERGQQLAELARRGKYSSSSVTRTCSTPCAGASSSITAVDELLGRARARGDADDAARRRARARSSSAGPSTRSTSGQPASRGDLRRARSCSTSSRCRSPRPRRRRARSR